MPWKEIEEKIKEKIVENDNGCWIWQSNEKRYPRVYFPGLGSVSMHRASYEFYNGPVSNEAIVMHTCDNKKCVNPEHLVLGTQKQNIQDMIRKGRGIFQKNRGEKHWNNKLSDKKVEEVFGLNEQGYTQKNIADLLGVNQSQVSRILSGLRRK